MIACHVEEREMLMDVNGKEMMSENRVKQEFQNRLTIKPSARPKRCVKRFCNVRWNHLSSN